MVKERANCDGDTFVVNDFKYLVDRIAEDNAKKKGKTGAELEPAQSAVKLF